MGTMTSRIHGALFVLCLLLGGVLVGFTLFAPSPTVLAEASHGRAHCESVGVALDIDAMVLEGDDQAMKHSVVSFMFYEPGALASYGAITDCARLAGKTVDLKRHDECVLKQDYRCLAELVRASRAATEPR